MRVLSWIIMIPFALVVVIFSASNRGLVTLNLWPFPIEVSVPMFTLVLTIFIVGFLFGGIVMWFSAGKVRRRARNERWRAESAERELHSTSNRLEDRERELRDSKSQQDGDSPSGLPAKATGT